MGGVDIADQLRAAYSSHIPSRRTWLPLFFWLIDTSATNGYIVLSDIDSSWKNKHRNLKLEFAHELVGLLHERRVRTRSSADLEKSDLTPKKAKGAEAGGYVKKESPTKHFMAANEHHFPEAVSHTERRSCYNCRLKGRKVSRSSTRCRSCGLFLCITKERNCFAELHEEVLNKDSIRNPTT